MQKFYVKHHILLRPIKNILKWFNLIWYEFYSVLFGTNNYKVGI